MATKDVTITVVGSGGDGVVTLGELIAQVAAHEGLNVIKTEAYGPQIRGGESSCTVRVASSRIFSQGAAVDVLVVFSWNDFKRFRGEISVASGAVILGEASEEPPSAEDLGIIGGDGLTFLQVPFAELSKTATGAPASKNVVALGILGGLLGLPAEKLQRALARKFGRKKAAVLEAVGRALQSGLEFAESRRDKFESRRLDYEPAPSRLLLSGNEAAAIGALHAGCRFFAGYPITPSSEILHFLGEWMPRAGGSFLQTEDELAAIGAVIGASFAGVKAMTATSGPGLSLMIEMIGLSSMAEVPVVIIDVQRGGPSTGNPTKSEQADLLQCLFGTHGDAPQGRARVLRRRGLLPRDRRGVQHRRRVPDPGARPLRPGRRPAQGDDHERRHARTRCATAASRPRRSWKSTSATATRRPGSPR